LSNLAHKNRLSQNNILRRFAPVEVKEPVTHRGVTLAKYGILSRFLRMRNKGVANQNAMHTQTFLDVSHFVTKIKCGVLRRKVIRNISKSLEIKYASRRSWMVYAKKMVPRHRTFHNILRPPVLQHQQPAVALWRHFVCCLFALMTSTLTTTLIIINNNNNGRSHLAPYRRYRCSSDVGFAVTCNANNFDLGFRLKISHVPWGNQSGSLSNTVLLRATQVSLRSVQRH